jgi:hypothetical protein
MSWALLPGRLAASFLISGAKYSPKYEIGIKKQLFKAVKSRFMKAGLFRLIFLWLESDKIFAGGPPEMGVCLWHSSSWTSWPQWPGAS